MTDLPLPDADARAHSERVAAFVRAAIVEAGGWIPFARYMELALYAPGLGYYAAGAAKFGGAGDFVTAPELTPLFGMTLARQVGAILNATRERTVLELGAGTGRLAASLLAGLDDEGIAPARYLILERSPDLRERQRATLERDAPSSLSRVQWLDTLPETMDGCVIANEVLDAIACHVVRREGAAWLERGVIAVDDRNAPHFGLALADAPADVALARVAADRFPREGDYVSEVNPAAEALVADLARRIASGAALFIDYGFPAREYYHVQRTSGTLMCHYRHRAHHDPLFFPGLSDITAHVDFSAMAAAGVHAGLEVAGFNAQAPFLLGCGMLDRLSAIGDPDSLDYLRAASQVQKLLAPTEMGELFKVLALARTGRIAWPGYALGNRRNRL
jgi:SAM-dependent MidA family methyltransferase